MGLDTFDPNAPQPRPQETEESVSVTDLVMQDMRVRREGGVKKYGTELKTHNGRDPLVDSYQEVLDTALYLRQAIYEKYGT